MSIFKFYLNNTLLDNEPMGWDSAKIKIKRDQKLHGIFITYTSDLTFFGDGYTLIKDALFNGGLCQSLTVLIEKQCADNGTFEEFFKGRIYVKDAEFDLTKCTAKCKVEDENYSNVILNNMETQVTIVSGGGKSLNGVGLSDIEESLNFFDSTGAYAGSPYANVPAYHAKNLFDYCVRYITDDAVQVSSTFLTTTAFFHGVWDIDFGAISTGKTVTVSFINAYGETLNVSETKSMSDTDTNVNDRLRKALTYWQANKADNNNDFRYFANAEQGPFSGGPKVPTKLTLYYWFPHFTVVGATNDGVDVAVTNPSGGSDPSLAYPGGGPFLVTTAAKMQGKDDPMRITLKDMFENINSYLGIGFKIATSGGTTTMYIEDLEAFYSTPPAITLENVNNISLKINSGLYKSATTGEGNDENTQLAFRNETWAIPTCLGEDYKLAHSMLASNDAIFDGFSTTEVDTKYIIYAENAGGTTWNAQQFHELRGNGGSEQTVYRYNVPLMNFNCVYKNLLSFPGNLKREGFTLTKPANLPNLIYSYEFEHPLTATQMAVIMADPVKAIKFDDTTGWIDELEYDVKKGMGKFKMLVAS